MWSGHWEAGAAPRRPHLWGPEKAASAFWKSESPLPEPHLQHRAPVRRKRLDSAEEWSKVRMNYNSQEALGAPLAHNQAGEPRGMLDLVGPITPTAIVKGAGTFSHPAYRCNQQ